MNRYNNGKVYAIRSHRTDRVYIGSTCDALPKRLYAHRKDKKLYEAGKRCDYVSSYEMLNYEDHYIDLVEEYPCDNKMQLCRREGEVMRATENTVNRNIAGRTKAEWYRDNVQQIKQRTKKHYQDNVEQIKEKQRQYHQRPEVKQHRAERHECGCGGRYATIHKLSHLKTKRHREFEAFVALTEEQVRAWLY